MESGSDYDKGPPTVKVLYNKDNTNMKKVIVLKKIELSNDVSFVIFGHQTPVPSPHPQNIPVFRYPSRERVIQIF